MILLFRNRQLCPTNRRVAVVSPRRTGAKIRDLRLTDPILISRDSYRAVIKSTVRPYRAIALIIRDRNYSHCLYDTPSCVVYSNRWTHSIIMSAAWKSSTQTVSTSMRVSGYIHSHFRNHRNHLHFHPL